MTPDDLLRTPGEILLEARRRAGLSLDELAELTKIAPPMLEAVERDEYHRLSDPLYVKSFLRTYAVEVGLDADEVLDVYARSVGGASAPAPTAEGVWEEQRVTINRVGLPWGRIVPVVAGVALVVVVVVLLVRGCADGDGGTADAGRTLPPTETVATNSPEVTPEPTAAADTNGHGDAAGDPAAADPPLRPTGAAANAVVVRDPEPVSVAPPPAPDLPAALPGDPALNLAGPRRGDLVLRVLATAPVRVRVRRDGEHVYRTVDLAGPGGSEETLPSRGIVPGRAYAVREGSVVYWGARDHFSLKLDPVTGVSVQVNGSPRDLSRLRSGQEMILDAHAAD